MISGMNLYAYCLNNPVKHKDPYGNSWLSDAWDSLKNWFSNTFGAYIDLSRNITKSSQDYFFVGYEEGVKTGKIVGDDSKPISFFSFFSSEWWKIWEYQIGYKISTEKFSFSYSFGIGEQNYSIGWDNQSIDFQFGINKIGLGTSTTLDNVTHYNQCYIRTIPTAALVVVIIFAPQLLPVLPSIPVLT